MKSIIKYQSRPAVKLVTLAQDVRIKTTLGDFPWNFVCLTQLDIIYWFET